MTLFCYLEYDLRRVKTIKSKNKKLLSNIILVFLIVALPLFVWAIVTQRFDTRKRASSGEPSTCVPVNNVITVTPSESEGNDPNDLGCHNIQQAIDAVTGDGYTVLITPGQYYVSETISVGGKSNINITGDSQYGSNAATINFSDNSFGFLVQGSSGSIHWLNIQGGSANGMLSIKSSSNFAVGYSNIYSQNSHTVDVQDSYNVNIYNCDIQSSAGGVEVQNSNNVTVSNNKIHNTANALTFFNSSGFIFANLIYENRENAITLNKPISLEIYSNTLTNNQRDGLSIIFVEQIYDTIVDVYKNVITNNRYGINGDSTIGLVDVLRFNFNDVWGNSSSNYYGLTAKTGTNGNISADPLYGTDPIYCVYPGSPVLYGLVANGEYMGATLYCNQPYPPSSSPYPIAKPGDINGDNKVNLIDIGIAVDEFDKTNPTNPRADVNNSGKVDLIDIGLLIDYYEW